jgi:hypothetical protein
VTILRWLLMPVAAFAAWAVSLFVGLLLHEAAIRLCPGSQMVSGLCVAPWWSYADTAVLCAGAAVAAATIVIACSLTAPSHRRTAAVVVFAIGFVWALALAIAGNAYLALIAAGAAGVLAVRWVWRRYR